MASVVSNSVRPHRRLLIRLPVPGILQARTLEWVAISFSDKCMKVKRESEVAQSCLTLSDPMDCSLPGSSLGPRDFPGKSAGAGCHCHFAYLHFFFETIVPKWSLGGDITPVTLLLFLCFGFFGISQTRDWANLPCIGKRSLNHWATREDPTDVIVDLENLEAATLK